MWCVNTAAWCAVVFHDGHDSMRHLDRDASVSCCLACVSVILVMLMFIVRGFCLMVVVPGEVMSTPRQEKLGWAELESTKPIAVIRLCCSTLSSVSCSLSRLLSTLVAGSHVLVSTRWMRSKLLVLHPGVSACVQYAVISSIGTDDRDQGVLLEHSPVHHDRLLQQQQRRAAAANAEGSPHLGGARSLSPVRNNVWVSLSPVLCWRWLWLSFVCVVAIRSTGGALKISSLVFSLLIQVL